jgi:hypothetical protein
MVLFMPFPFSTSFSFTGEYQLYKWQYSNNQMVHNEELHNLYSSPNIIRMIKLRMRWTGHVERMGKKRNAYRVLVWNPEGKKPLGRPRRGWVENIKIELREMGWDELDQSVSE